MKPPPGKYRIGAFRPFVPDWLRFTTLLVAAMLFQLSGIVYLTNLGEMVGATGLTSEDVRLLASTAFIGMTMTFPVMFRLKFRFMSRTILTTCSLVLIAGNLVPLLTTAMPVLLLTAFVVGFFKMWGTFECISSIQLVITPKRDLSVFFCFVYLLVLGCVQFSGLLSAAFADRGDWRQMHLAIIAAHTLLIAWLAFTLRPFRFMRPMPLYQIDWLGFSLWSALLLMVNFVLEYGRRLDWLASDAIRAALAAALMLAVCAVYRLRTSKRPVIPPACFGYKNLLVAFVLYAAMQVLLGPTNVVLPAFTAGVLKYDVLNTASLNWAVFAGVVVGTACAYYWHVLRHGGYKPIVFCGFLCLVLSQLLLYRAIAPSLAQASFYAPYALRGAGQVLLYISLTIYVTEQVPFPHFIPGLAMIGFIRSAVGTTLANGLCNQLLEHFYKAHRLVLGQGLDALNPAAASLQESVAHGALAHGLSAEQARIAATSALYGKLQLQAMLVSWKELLGWWTLLGAGLLLAISTYHYVKPTFQHLPSMLQMAVYLNPFPQLTRRLRREPVEADSAATIAAPTASTTAPASGVTVPVSQ